MACWSQGFGLEVAGAKICAQPHTFADPRMRRRDTMSATVCVQYSERRCTHVATSTVGAVLEIILKPEFENTAHL